MGPTAFDLRIIHLFLRYESNPLLVDVSDTLSRDLLVSGFVFVVPIAFKWKRFDTTNANTDSTVMTIVIGTLIALAIGLLSQLIFKRSPPVISPVFKDSFALHYMPIPNQNSFPSFSSVVFSVLAFGTAAWNFSLAIGLFAWLLFFVEPIQMFVGARYPTDVAAGLVIGFCSLASSKWLANNGRFFERLMCSRSYLLESFFFLWLFEAACAFQDVFELVHLVIPSVPVR